MLWAGRMPRTQPFAFRASGLLSGTFRFSAGTRARRSALVGRRCVASRVSRCRSMCRLFSTSAGGHTLPRRSWSCARALIRAQSQKSSARAAQNASLKA